VKFYVDSQIKEGGRDRGVVTLKFSMTVGTEPSVARIFVAGSASVSGSDEDVHMMLAGPETDGPPSLFMKIYQQAYPTMYLLCSSLGIPCPAPGLVRLNRIAAAERVEQ